MKQFLIPITLSLSIAISSPSYAGGVLTFNVLDYVQSTMRTIGQVQKEIVDSAQYIQVLEQWYTQARVMKQQAEQLKEDYDSITGIRSVGDFLNNDFVAQNIPDGWENTFSALRQDGYAGLSVAAAEIYDELAFFDTCAGHLPKEGEEGTSAGRLKNELYNLCEARILGAAHDSASAVAGLKSVEDMMRDIAKVGGKIGQDFDLKAAATTSQLIAQKNNELIGVSLIHALNRDRAKAAEELNHQLKREIKAEALSHGYRSPFSTVLNVFDTQYRNTINPTGTESQKRQEPELVAMFDCQDC